MTDKIWLSAPHMGGNELKFVQEAFESNWIAPVGPAIEGFENDLAHQLGNQGHVTALSSGTAALHLALILAGIGAGDEVLCQSMTFAASANPIMYLGARPLFIDSEPSTWNISPELVTQAIEEGLRKNMKPKAIIAVDLYGMPANWHQLRLIAEEYEVTLIEDAAEALGSTLNNKPCGTFGDISILSFNGNKIITTSGGGALVSKNPTVTEKAKYLSTQARDPAPHFQHSSVGYNYRLSNICAAIGRGQLQVLDQRVQQRRKIFDQYRSSLESIEGIGFLHEPQGYFSNRWLTTIIVNPERTNGVTREHLRVALEKENIEARPLWKPLHLQPVFSQCGYIGGKVAENLFSNGLCLPSSSSLSPENQERIVNIIRNCLS